MKQNEQIIIDNIIEELVKKRDIAILKMKEAMLKDEVSMYRLQETLLIMFYSEFVNLQVN
jgi:hypothetical protein